jgi:hypothetical protein
MAHSQFYLFFIAFFTLTVFLQPTSHASPQRPSPECKFNIYIPTKKIKKSVQTITNQPTNYLTNQPTNYTQAKLARE